MRKMKKLFALLFAAALLLAVLSARAQAAQTGVCRVIASVADVYAAADLTSDKVGEVYEGMLLEVTASSRGFGQITVRSAGISGWVRLADMEYTGDDVSGTVKGIRVVPPEKTTFIHETEQLDLTGMKVYAVYENGMQITVTGYEVYCDSMDSLGQKEIRVTYTPKGSDRTFADSFKVTVARYPVSGLTVIKPPDRTLYMEHEKLDLTGLVLKITYSDGRPEQMCSLEDVEEDPHFTVSGCCGEAAGKILEKGEHTVTVSYRYDDIVASFPVSVAPRALTALSISREPDSLVTHHRDRPPDISGLVLKAEYDNGEVEEVDGFDCEVVCDPSAFVLGENNPVDVYFGGMSVRLYYRLSLNNATGIVAVPAQTSFIAGRAVDLSGLRVRLVYADGTFENITDYEMTSVDPEKEGSQNIIVRYGEYSDVFTISITANYRTGDVDGNGKIQPEDARLTLRAAVGYIRLTGMAFQAADADGDNAVTPADARLILRASVGLEKL